MKDVEANSTSAAGNADEAVRQAGETVTDETLMARLRAGEMPAGEALAKRHYDPLMRYLRHLVDAATAEEMFQQTWLSVLEYADRFDVSGRQGGFKAWLFRIATNKVNDHWRSRGREKAMKRNLAMFGEAVAPGADARLETTEHDAALKAAMNRLPESQRQVLVMRYYSDLKFVEIAEILGCPLNTALGRVHKAIQRLRRIMDGGSD